MHMVSGAVLERWVGLSDEDVVDRVLQGQTALFEVIMRRHNERIYRAARAILRDGKEAEDVMQQAYVNAYAHLRQFDKRAKFSTWLTKIAVNEALARARKQGRYEPLESDTGNVETFMSASTAPNPEHLAFLARAWCTARDRRRSARRWMSRSVHAPRNRGHEHPRNRAGAGRE
jgi:RNA polymerase sigma factor (sigma-70 family)